MRTREEEGYERHGFCGDPDDDHETITGWCECCSQECEGIEVDNGVGRYEFWGFKGTHHQIDIESLCCNSRVLDHDPNPDEEDCDVES